jgi:hypothetical protein
MQHLVGSGTPVLYIGRTVLKGEVILYGILERRVGNDTSAAVGTDYIAERRHMAIKMIRIIVMREYTRYG